MKLPEKPPASGYEHLSRLPKEKILRIVAPHKTLVAFFEKANSEYYYWDKFKQVVPRTELGPQEAWIALKRYRQGQARTIPLEDSVHKTPFSYFITPSMLSLLSKIDQYTAGTLQLDDEHNLRVAGNERFMISSLMEEAIASSKIEGAATTRLKAKQMLRDNEKPETHDQKMILNNYETVLSIREKWQHEKLTPEIIREIQQSMTRGTLKHAEEEGRYRTPKDDEEGFAVYDEAGSTLHVPPPAAEIEKRVEALCAFANAEHQDEKFIHPVLKAIMLHFWLAYIHPFVDGNGRTARALFYWYILSRKYWLFEYIPVSRIILNARTQYLHAFLHTEYDGGDLNYFLMNQLRAVDHAVKDFKSYLMRKKQEDGQSYQLLRANPDLNRRQSILLRHALRHPNFMYTLKGHQNACGIVYETARKDLTDLVRLGFMEMHSRGKKFFFTAVQDLGAKIQQK